MCRCTRKILRCNWKLSIRCKTRPAVNCCIEKAAEMKEIVDLCDLLVECITDDFFPLEINSIGY